MNVGWRKIAECNTSGIQVKYIKCFLNHPNTKNRVKEYLMLYLEPVAVWRQGKWVRKCNKLINKEWLW